VRVLASVFVALLLIGCGGTQTPQAKAPARDTTKPAPVEVSFAKDIQSIVTANCMPCHSGGKDAKGGYDLTSYSGMMGGGSDSIPNVIPGRADSSLLYLRVTGDVPTQMPIGRPPLDAAHMSTVQRWINQGAKNN
jgi:hypothetical protein